VFNSNPCELKVSRGEQAFFSILLQHNMLIQCWIGALDFNAGIAEMLGQSNYLAIVGGGRNPKFPQNKVCP
jgi:hypothetical protein